MFPVDARLRLVERPAPFRSRPGLFPIFLPPFQSGVFFLFFSLAGYSAKRSREPGNTPHPPAEKNYYQGSIYFIRLGHSMASPEQQMESLRESLSRVILDQLAETLRDYPSGSLTNPVLRFEAFIQDGDTEAQGRSPRSPVVSVSCNSSELGRPSSRWPLSICSLGRDNRVIHTCTYILRERGERRGTRHGKPERHYERPN